MQSEIRWINEGKETRHASKMWRKSHQSFENWVVCGKKSRLKCLLFITWVYNLENLVNFSDATKQFTGKRADTQESES